MKAALHSHDNWASPSKFGVLIGERRESEGHVDVFLVEWRRRYFHAKHSWCNTLLYFFAWCRAAAHQCRLAYWTL